MAPLLYDDIVDIRWNRFYNGGNGRFEPLAIGWPAGPFGFSAAEVRTIPLAAPFVIKLYEVPQQNAPSTTEITLGAATLTEKGLAVTPGNLQYRVSYYDELGAGQIEFNALQAGETVTIKYYGLGHGFQKISLDTRVPSTGNTTISDVKTFEDGLIRGELGSALKDLLLPIGVWNMDLTIGIDVPHGLGTFVNIIFAFATVFEDDGNGKYPLTYMSNTGTPQGGVGVFDNANIRVNRLDGGIFDSVAFNKTVGPFNRGHVYVVYSA